MSRPTFGTISNGVGGWDATVNDNTSKIGSTPLPLAQSSAATNPPVAATVEGNFAAADYEGCIVSHYNTTAGTWTLWFSDGTTWRVVTMT